MQHAELIQRARDFAGETFAQLGLGNGHEPQEVILVRDGAYCGRRFEVEGAQAVWAIAEDRLTMISAGGEVLGEWAEVSRGIPVSRKAA
jgi:hypothetical protein